MFDVSGKVAIVTGGGRGIGKAIVMELAKAGVKICFTNRNAEMAAKVAEEVKAAGGECISVQGDIADPDHCAEVVKATADAFGRIDILVNNAGITKDNLFMRMKQEEWSQVIDTNLTGVFNMSKAVIKTMMKQKYGKIINISSVVGHTGNPGQVNYASTKAGLLGFTKSLAKELAARNITCNAIAPGFIETDMTGELNEKQQEELLKNVPAGRMGKSEEVAAGVLFLASEGADYITGTTLHINGGMY